MDKNEIIIDRINEGRRAFLKAATAAMARVCPWLLSTYKYRASVLNPPAVTVLPVASRGFTIGPIIVCRTCSICLRFVF